MAVRWALVVLVAFFQVHALANATSLPPITLDRSYDYLNGYIEVYDDHTKQLTIQDVLKIDPPKWEIINENVVNRRTIDAIVWLHFKVDARLLEQDFEPRQLIINFVLLADVQLFAYSKSTDSLERIHDNKAVNHHFVERKASEAVHNSNIFDLPVRRGVVNDYYIRVDAQNMSLIPVLLMTKDERLQWSTRRTMYSFYYYGAMSIMVVFFLFLFLRSKERLYILFAAQISTVAAYNIMVDGYATQFIVSHSSISPIKFAALFALINVVFTCLFTSHFLETKKRSPKLHVSFLGMTALSLLLIPLIPFLSPLILVQMLIVITACQSPLLVGSSFWIYFKGHKEVKFLALGVSVYVSFSCILAWSFEGILPWSNTTPYYLHVGSAFLAIFVSIALIDRFNKLREEKLAIERSAKSQLEALNADLVKSNQLKDEFLSTISHELRTPMNGVLGALELMKGDELTKQSRTHYSIANQSAQEMIRLVDDLLCLSELNGNERTRVDSIFSLSDLKEYLLDNLQQKADAKGLDLKIEIGHCDRIWLSSDIDKLKNILYHFVDNGIKFTDKGGVEVTVNCENLENRKVELRFIVQDTGIGIEQDKLGGLFDAFKQADGSYSRRFNGLGIGMSICAKMVNSLEGTIQIDSISGIGTKITVKVPVNLMDPPQELRHSCEEANTEEQQLSQIKALVIEDNAVNQKVLAGILKKLNVDSVLACNGLEGADICNEQEFDIVFMDCQMPVMDGFESTRKIRSSCGLNSNVPIIAVTANATAKDKQKCFSSGMNDFLKKPIKKNDIKEILDKYASSKELA